MSARLVLLYIVAVLAMLLASTSASARVEPQTRVTAFDVMRASCTELEASRTLEHRRANRVERAENASGSCVAAEGGGLGGGGSTTFLHGAPTAAAEDIAANGLRPVSTSTGAHPAGSFFTHEASHPMSPVAASHWPVVQGKVPRSGVSVVGMQVPNGVMANLRGMGLVRTGPVPGVVGFPPETVFYPGAIPILNQHATFVLMPPTF